MLLKQRILIWNFIVMLLFDLDIVFMEHNEQRSFFTRASTPVILRPELPCCSLSVS